MSQFNKRAITELLKTFSKAEVKEFRKFVTYKGRKSVVSLWETLYKSHPDYALTDKELYEAVRPKEAFKDSAYRIWVTELNNLAKEFVATNAFLANPHLFNNTVSKALLNRRVEKMGQKVLAQQKKALGKIEQPNIEYYAQYFDYEDIAYQYDVRFSHHEVTDSLQKAVDYLDYSYIAQKLKFLCAIRNRCRILEEAYVFRMEEQLLDYLAAEPQEDHPLIHSYYLMLRLMRDLDEHEGFVHFLAYFKENRNQINPVEGRQLATAAVNFCFWNINRGHLHYLKSRLEIAKIMVQEGFVLIKGQMPVYHFRNLVEIAIAAGAEDWAEAFINKWLPLVDKAYQPYLEAFNRAYLHFSKAEYKAQSVWMQHMESDDFVFIDVQDEIAFRILKLKTTYKQLGPQPKRLANDAFHAQLDAFRNYLNRQQKVAENTKASAKNFKKALHQLHQQKIGKALKIGDLHSYFLELKPLRGLSWLLDELEQVLAISG